MSATASFAVARAAMAWWASRRPLSYSLGRHIANPIANTASAEERALARACAVWADTTRRRRGVRR